MDHPSNPRRSKRLLAANKENCALLEKTAEPTDATEKRSSSQLAVAPPLPAKRQKVTHQTRRVVNGNRRNRGFLRDLLSMPLDILTEIFSHLHPLDLLHLTWTTKFLRASLMQRHMTSVWKSARGNIGMPECPPDLSEPQFAFLAFDLHCHYCDAPRVTEVMWPYRLRCCSKCVNIHYVEHSQVHEFLPIKASSDIRHHPTKHYHWLPCIFERHKGRYRRLYSRAALDNLKQGAARHKNRLSTFLKERIELSTALMAHGDLCAKWYNHRMDMRRNELQDARERRRNAIMGKLQEGGWADEISTLNHWYPNYFSDHHLVKQPKDLTERIWKNVEGPLVKDIQLMLRVREDQISSRLARQGILAQLMKSDNLSDSKLPEVPGIADICEMDDFQDIFYLPSTIQVTAAHFHEPLSNIDQHVVKWLIRTYLELIDLLPTPGPGSDLFLATTFFRCCISSECVEPSDTGRILAHRCLTKLFHSLDPSCDTRKALYYRDLGSEPWNFGGSRVEFHHEASTVAHKLVTLYGLDPLVTECDEMNQDEPMYHCGLCSSRKEWIVYPWSIAVAHTFTIHNGEEDWSLFDRPIPEDATIHVGWPEDKVLELRLRPDFMCKLCRESFNELELGRHGRERHGLTSFTTPFFKLHCDTSDEHITSPRTIQLAD